MFAALLSLLLTTYPAPAPAPAADVPPIEQFKPSRDGFRFVNHFSGSPLPKALELLAGGAIDMNFGLCGGMSFAAADLFVSRRARPQVATQPVKGSSLYSYIYQRQVESFGAGFAMVPRFALWMSLPEPGPLGLCHLTAASLPDVSGHLDRHEPAILGLVLAAASGPRRGQLWENHQVLCYGVERPTPGLTRLKIYDPNYPGADDAAIEMRLTLLGPTPSPIPTVISFPLAGVACTRVVPGHPSTAVRGVFVMPYQPRVPPASLSDTP